MIRLSVVLQCLLLSAFVPGIAAAQLVPPDSFPSGQATEFARVVHDDGGEPLALQVAIARYGARRGGAEVTVDLVGAVHVGDTGYYAELNQRFRDYDAVLFELIAPEGSQDRIQSTPRTGFISNAQLAMTKALGLSFQLDEIDYRPDNFVHADLSPSELSQSMADRGESLYVYFWRMFYASVNEAAKDPLGLRAWRDMTAAIRSDQDNPVKIAFAYEMTNIDAVSQALNGDSGSAIIDARNKRAVDVLQEEIRKGSKNIAIFYGVAHMPDFEDRLLGELDLDYLETIWVNAWRLAEPREVP
jgi:hypothetical protein